MGFLSLVGERGIAERVCDIGVCCNFLGLPLCFPRKIFGKLSGFYLGLKKAGRLPKIIFFNHHLVRRVAMYPSSFKLSLLAMLPPPTSNIAIENRPFEDVSGQIIIIHQPGKT